MSSFSEQVLTLSDIEKREEMIKKDVEIIKPYLEKKGVNFSKKHKYDISAYYIARKDDIRYLAFGIGNYDDSKEFYGGYNATFGQIVYDIYGNVLIDYEKKKARFCYLYGGHDTYEEVNADKVFSSSGMALIGDYDDRSRKTLYKVYNYYKGEFLPVDVVDDVSEYIRSSSGEVFLQTDPYVYNVQTQCALNGLEFDFVHGVNWSPKNDDYGFRTSLYHSDELKNKIYEIVLKNNVLYASKHIVVTQNRSWNIVDKREADTFVFLDTDGNIVSDLYLRTADSFKALPVTNATYNDVIKSIEDGYLDDINKQIEQEFNDKLKERQMMDDSRNKMLETLNAYLGKPGVQKSIKSDNLI